jgi:hypothetical protein
MRSFACAAATLVLVSALSCRKQQSNETGGVSDTASTPAAAPAAVPETPETPAATSDFTFDQRQTYAQSIRQQLSGIDRQIQDLAAQAKSRGGAVSDRALANVRAARRAVDRSLKSVDAATAANWDQVKQSVNRSVENLSESIEVAQPK